MTDQNVTQWTLEGADHQTIYGNTHQPVTRSNVRGVLILCHGFKGYKDYGFFPYLAQKAAEAGLIAHRFNFSHSGMTEQTETFARPDLFEKDTWHKQIQDIQCVVHAMENQTLAGNDLPYVLFGHSRGGLSVLVAAGHTDLTPAGVVGASSVNQACHLLEEQIYLLKEEGFLVSPSSRTGQQLRIGRAWLEDIQADPQAVDPMIAIAKITCPILLIHGEADQTVPVQCTLALAKRNPSQVTTHLIPDASHVYNAANPMKQAPPATCEMVEQTCQFALRACRQATRI